MADSEVSGAIGSGTSSCFPFGACQVDWRRLDTMKIIMMMKLELGGKVERGIP